MIVAMRRLIYGGFNSFGLGGNFFLKVTETLGGTGFYNGKITLATPVPEPETYGMMLAGIGLMAFIARRLKGILTFVNRIPLLRVFY